METNYVLITAARNEADFIESTIKSVAIQTLKPRKWIIVSDRSSDETEESIELREKYDESIMANECRGFLDLIAGKQDGPGGAPHPGVDDGYKALQVSHAMLKSSRENRVIKV